MAIAGELGTDRVTCAGRGGRRAGSGRKPASPLGPRIVRNLRLSPEADAAVLADQEQHGGTYTDALERLVMPGIRYVDTDGVPPEE